MKYRVACEPTLIHSILIVEANRLSDNLTKRLSQYHNRRLCSICYRLLPSVLKFLYNPKDHQHLNKRFISFYSNYYLAKQLLDKRIVPGTRKKRLREGVAWGDQRKTGNYWLAERGEMLSSVRTSRENL
jgi:hypothetical protein